MQYNVHYTQTCIWGLYLTFGIERQLEQFLLLRQSKHSLLPLLDTVQVLLSRGRFRFYFRILLLTGGCLFGIFSCATCLRIGLLNTRHLAVKPSQLSSSRLTDK